MAMTVNRRKDKRRAKVVLHRVADIPGGVGVKVADLGGDFLEEGSLLGAPQNGLYPVLKTAILTKDLAANGKNPEVVKGSHFKVNDFIGVIGGKAAKITAIDKSAADKDVITIDEVLGKIDKGSALTQAAGAADGDEAKAEPAFKPIAVTGTGYPVKQGDNLFTDAWVIAVVKSPAIESGLDIKGIINL